MRTLSLGFSYSFSRKKNSNSAELSTAARRAFSRAWRARMTSPFGVNRATIRYDRSAAGSGAPGNLGSRADIIAGSLLWDSSDGRRASRPKWAQNEARSLLVRISDSTASASGAVGSVARYNRSSRKFETRTQRHDPRPPMAANACTTGLCPACFPLVCGASRSVRGLLNSALPKTMSFEPPKNPSEKSSKRLGPVAFLGSR